MLKYFSFKSLLTAIFFIMFFAYLREQLIADAIRNYSDISSSLSPWCVFGMIMMIGIYAISKRNFYLGFGSIPKYYRNIVVYTLAISVIWSFSNPLSSMNTYLLLVLPAFIVWFSYCIVYTENDDNLYLFFLVLGMLVLTKSFYDTIEYRILLGAREESQVNTSYYLLYLTPLFLCSKSNILKIVSVTLVFLVVLTSVKRGGTIAISISVLSYIFTNYVLVEKNTKLFRNLLFVLMIVFVGGYYLVEYLESSDLAIVSRLIQTAENDGREARTDIWVKVVDMITSSNTLNLFIGHGYNMVLVDNPLGFSAHNDFLEIAYDFGLIALIIYIFLFYKIFNVCKEMISKKSKYAGAMVFSFCLLLVNSMVSHIYIYPFYASIFGLVWGTIYALYVKEQYK